MSRKQNSLMRFTRTERLAQLSEQEIVIEQKKREIQAKIEARRKNQNEENLKKLEAHKETKNISKPGFPENVHKRDGDVDNQYNGESGIEEKKDSLKNAFSNDGSFLDQFKKLSQSGLIPANYKAGASQSFTKEVIDNKEGSSAIESPSLMLKSYIPVNSSVHLNQNTEEAPHKTHTIDTISMKFKNNTVKKLDPISNPLNDDDEDTESEDDSTKKDKFPIKEHIPLGKTRTEKEDSLRISSAFSNYKEKEKNSFENEANLCHLAEMVARNGDEFEETLKKQHENDPSYRFLFDKKSKEYIFFHHLVLKYKQNSLKNRKPHDSSSDESDSNLNKRKSSMQKREGNIGQGQDSSGSDSSQKQRSCKNKKKRRGERNSNNYQGDSEEETNYYKMPEGSSQEGFAPVSNYSSESSNLNKNVEKDLTSKTLEKSTSEDKRKRKRKSRWGDAVSSTSNIQPPTLVTNLNLQPLGKVPAPKTNLLSQLTRSDPGLIQYAKQTFGSTNLSEEDWKKAEDHYKINLLYQDLVKKRAEISKLERAGKFKYEYDSDEDVEGGTWEHKLRQQEMLATQLWAEELTRQAAGKHHIGDFLPPEELEKFMERYNAVKEGREPDLSDYKEFKLKEDNVGYKLLQKMGWNEGQGLGQDGSGITNPVNKATTRHENQGLGVERPDGLEPGDDEYDAYRKRMMLAYRFRPNPLNNPRRPYY